MVRQIHISPVLNGFVCKVGCQTVVFTSRQSMLDGIDAYYERPEETERQMLSNPVNQMLENPLTPPSGPCVDQPANESGEPREYTTGGIGSYLRSKGKA